MELAPSTILLIGADHLTWRGLHALLMEQPQLHLLADVHARTEALRIAMDQRPDYMLVDAGVADPGLIPLVRELRRRSPASRIIVIGTRESLQHEMLLRLKDLAISSYLLWEELRGETVIHSLLIIADGNMVAEHRAVLDEMVTERRGRPRGDEPALSDDERSVLTLLIGDLTPGEIAETLHGRRTGAL